MKAISIEATPSIDRPALYVLAAVSLFVLLSGRYEHSPHAMVFALATLEAVRRMVFRG